jgi:AmmeMemoRadiSam system protein B
MNIFSAMFLTLVSLSFLVAQEIRPIRDSLGYCWNMEPMKRLVAYLESTEPVPNLKRELIAGISPHDDYLYAARIYFPLLRSIKSQEVVIFGVTHSTVRKEIGDPQGILLLDEYKSWEGCGKAVEISPLREFIKNNLDTQYYHVNNHAHELEHSIEAMVPWLQYFNPGVRMIPIMVTAMPFERMDEISQKLSEVLTAYIARNALVPGKDIFFLFSSDANHYGNDFQNAPFGEDSAAHAKGIERDRQIAHQYLSGRVESEKIRTFTAEMKNLIWCGQFSVSCGLLTTMKTIEQLHEKKITGEIIRYSDSYTEGVLPLKQTMMGTTAPFSLKHWVGYLSAGYSLE